MGKQWVLLLAFSGLAACTGGSLANKSHPTATGGTVIPTGGTVVPTDASLPAKDSGLDSPDVGALAADAPSADTARTPDTKVDPLNAAPTCTSKTSWTTGNNNRMAPGQACIACHQASGDAPNYTIAGTLYPTGHEPDNCNGVNGTTKSVTVAITDANGRSITMTPNSVGNFYSISQVVFPYTVKVVDGQGGERIMLTATSNGDCNACHNQSGTSGAPGRVTLP